MAPPHDEEQASEHDSLLGSAELKFRHFWDGFVDFVVQDNVLQVAIGLV